MEVKGIEKSAKEYAIKCHSETNHLYDGKPYEFHLSMVREIAFQYIHLVPESSRENVLAACWTHDVIEDCRQTYNDVNAATNYKVASLVYALTNEKGKNRAERANGKYYSNIRSVPFAAFVKLCDRIANFEYSVSSGSSMAKKYASENDSFIQNIYTSEYEEMFNRLTSLV